MRFRDLTREQLFEACARQIITFQEWHVEIGVREADFRERARLAYARFPIRVGQ